MQSKSNELAVLTRNNFFCQLIFAFSLYFKKSLKIVREKLNDFLFIKKIKFSLPALKNNDTISGLLLRLL